MNLGESLLRFNFQQKYCVLDFETEGLNLFYSRPWQVSYNLFTKNEVLATYDKFILWRDLKMSPEAARVTRFDKAKYLSLAQEPKAILEDIKKIINDESIIIIWHNGIRFDEMIYNTLRRLCGEKPDYSFQNRSIDTLSLAKMYEKRLKVSYEDFFAWQLRVADMRMGKNEEGKTVKTNLGAMAEKLKIPNFDKEKLHNSDYDCDINRLVFLSIINNIDV